MGMMTSRPTAGISMVRYRARSPVARSIAVVHLGVILTVDNIKVDSEADCPLDRRFDGFSFPTAFSRKQFNQYISCRHSLMGLTTVSLATVSLENPSSMRFTVNFVNLVNLVDFINLMDLVVLATVDIVNPLNVGLVMDLFAVDILVIDQFIVNLTVDFATLIQERIVTVKEI